MSLINKCYVFEGTFSKTNTYLTSDRFEKLFVTFVSILFQLCILQRWRIELALHLVLVISRTLA